MAKTLTVNEKRGTYDVYRQDGTIALTIFKDFDNVAELADYLQAHGFTFDVLHFCKDGKTIPWN